MNDALRVSGFERFGDLTRYGQCLVQRESAMADAVRQRDSVDQLHYEGLHTVGVFESVDVRDVRMIQRSQNFGLALEAGEPIGV